MRTPRCVYSVRRESVRGPGPRALQRSWGWCTSGIAVPSADGAPPSHLTPTLSGQTLDLGPRDHRHLAQRDLYTRPTKNGRSRKGNVTTATLLPHQPAEAELWAKASSDLLSPHPPPPCGALVLGRMDGWIRLGSFGHFGRRTATCMAQILENTIVSCVMYGPSETEICVLCM